MFCNYCGSQNPDDARYCSYCGREIRIPASPPLKQASAGTAEGLLPGPVPTAEQLPANPAAAEAAPASSAPAKETPAGKLCPACGQTSAQAAIACDCGFDFSYGGPRPPAPAKRFSAISDWFARGKPQAAIRPGDGEKGRPAADKAAFGSLGKPRLIVVAIGCVITLLLMVTLQHRSPGYARDELAGLKIAYNSRSFLKASLEGNAKVVKLFLQAGMDPSIALHAAAHGAHPEIVQLLIEKGASVNSRDESGDTPLIDAVIAEDPKEVKLLLGLGADVNAAGTDSTELCSSPLMLAASSGNAEIVRLLLSTGANANAGRDGQTPLSCAFQGPKEKKDEVVRALLETGAVTNDARIMAQLPKPIVMPQERAQPKPNPKPVEITKNVSSSTLAPGARDNGNASLMIARRVNDGIAVERAGAPISGIYPAPVQQESTSLLDRLRVPGFLFLFLPPLFTLFIILFL